MPDNAKANAYFELIKTHWADLHHNRSQDWRFWIAVAAIIAGVVQLGAQSEPPASWAVSALLALGAVVSFVAARTASAHSALQIKKTSVISSLEFHALKALEVPWSEVKMVSYGVIRLTQPHTWHVSGLIYSLYWVLGVNFAIAFLFSLARNGLSSAEAVVVASPIAIGSAILFVSLGVLIGQYKLHKYRKGRLHAEILGALSLPAKPEDLCAFGAQWDKRLFGDERHTEESSDNGSNGDT